MAIGKRCKMKQQEMFGATANIRSPGVCFRMLMVGYLEGSRRFWSIVRFRQLLSARYTFKPVVPVDFSSLQALHLITISATDC